jgi:DNA-binding NarL/FixJ family response regulator
MIKVIIADDVPILRQGLKTIIEQNTDITVVALAENGKQAYELSVIHKPDVVLMDMRMPDYNGAYGIKLIKEKLAGTKVLVLTTFDDEETITEAMQSCADGYILKEMTGEKIINAIQAVYNGMNIFSQNAYKRVNKSITPTVDTSVYNLTEKEKNLLKLIADGCDNKEIAAKLFISDGTVRNNISKLLDKLNLRDRTQLAVFAIKNNII